MPAQENIPIDREPRLHSHNIISVNTQYEAGEERGEERSSTQSMNAHFVNQSKKCLLIDSDKIRQHL